MSSQIIEINLNRIEFVLKLFNFSKERLLEKLNEGRKRKLIHEDIFTDKIRLSYLRKIDKVFQQGLSFYTDPINLSMSKKSSIFFRKTDFNTALNLSDRQRVNKIEREISHINALATLSNYQLKRTLSRYQIDDSPQKAAEKMREVIYPKTKPQDDKPFLTVLINNLAEHNILVLEFLEAVNKKVKTTIDGFFIAPHFIALKRQRYNSQQSSNLQTDNFKREIFTLAHELGHYLLDKEELDQPVGQSPTQNEIEKWCDTFAFAFLMGQENLTRLNKIESPTFNNPQINELSNKTHISRLALFTNLTINNKISWETYKKVKDTLATAIARKQAELEEEKRRNKEIGIKPGFFLSKPIHSELEKSIYRNAFFEGVIEEYEVLSHFRIKEIDRFVYE